MVLVLVLMSMSTLMLMFTLSEGKERCIELPKEIMANIAKSSPHSYLTGRKVGAHDVQ